MAATIYAIIIEDGSNNICNYNRRWQQHFYLKMVPVVLMIKRNNVLIFIPKCTTETPKLVDFDIPSPQCLQVITNMITCPIKFKLFFQSLSTLVEMDFLETSRCFEALIYKVCKKSVHKG
jgi:hypothetical protein